MVLPNFKFRQAIRPYPSSLSLQWQSTEVCSSSSCIYVDCEEMKNGKIKLVPSPGVNCREGVKEKRVLMRRCLSTSSRTVWSTFSSGPRSRLGCSTTGPWGTGAKLASEQSGSTSWITSRYTTTTHEECPTQGTVCFLEKWPQTKCKVTFDTCFWPSFSCSFTW